MSHPRLLRRSAGAYLTPLRAQFPILARTAIQLTGIAAERGLLVAVTHAPTRLPRAQGRGFPGGVPASRAIAQWPVGRTSHADQHNFRCPREG
jgi:hypothetical protein